MFSRKCPTAEMILNASIFYQVSYVNFREIIKKLCGTQLRLPGIKACSIVSIVVHKAGFIETR